MGNKGSVCGDRCSGGMVHANQFVWPEQKRPAGLHRAGQTGLETTAGAPYYIYTLKKYIYMEYY